MSEIYKPIGEEWLDSVKDFMSAGETSSGKYLILHKEELKKYIQFGLLGDITMQDVKAAEKSKNGFVGRVNDTDLYISKYLPDF